MGTLYRMKELELHLPAGSHVLPPELAVALAEANDIVAAAETEADRIRAEARAMVETERARGYAEGLRQSREEAAARLVSETALLQQSLAGLENELAGLVIDCMRRLLDGFDDAEKCRAAVRAALSRMRREKNVHLRVAPEWFSTALASRATFAAVYPEIGIIEIFEDGSLSQCRLVVESALGRIEVDFDESLQNLQQLLSATASRTIACHTSKRETPDG